MGRNLNNSGIKKMHNGERRLAFWLATLIATSSLGVVALPTHAQTTEPIPVQAELRRFDIPAQTLTKALIQFGRQAGLQISADHLPNSFKDVRSSAISGTMTWQEGINLVLAGTGLTYRINGSMVVVERPGDGVTVLNPITVLSPITVKGQGETATGPVIGYVATRSASGTKTDTPLIETPQSVSVITADQLKARNVNKLTEALRYTPGVEPEPYGVEPRYTNLRIRGVNSALTGLFQDGMGLVNPSYIVSYNLEPWGAERIEVPRGPASVLYGQGSPGGLVNYISKRPTTETHRFIQLEGGNYNRFQGKFDVGGAVNDDKTLSLRLIGLVRDADRQIDFVEDDRVWFAPSLMWQPNQNTKVTLFGHVQQDDTKNSQALPGSGTLTKNANGKIPLSRFTGEPNVDAVDRTEFSAGYEVEHRVSDALNLRHKLRYHVVDLNDVVVYTNGFDGNSTITRRYYGNFGNLKSWTSDNNAEFKAELAGTKHTLLGGFDIQRTRLESVQTFGSMSNLDIFNPVYGDNAVSASEITNKNHLKTQQGLYLQDQIELGEHWRVTLGGRYDKAKTISNDHRANTHKNQQDSAFTGRAGATYLFGNGFAPYASYAESFLPVVGTDPDGKFYEPETGRQFEVGIKYQPPGQNSFVTLSAFDLRRQNFTEYNSATFQTLQTGKVRSRGIEAEITASLGTRIDVTAGYTYLQTEILKSAIANEVGRELSQAPQHTASIWGDYTFPDDVMKGLGLGAGLRYHSTNFGDKANTISVPGYTLVDAAIHYEMGKYRFGLNARNLFDKQYVGSCYSRNSSTLCTAGEALTVLANVTYDW